MSNPTTVLTVNYSQGNILQQYCGYSLPEKFSDNGVRKFTVVDRATFDRNLRQLFKAIKKVSPGFQARPKMMPYFGDPENWRQIPPKTIKVPAPGTKDGYREIEAPGQPDGEARECVDQYKTVELALNAMACDAVSMICFIASYAENPKKMSAMEIDEILGPIVDQLEIGPWLESELGLSQQQTVKLPSALKKAEEEKPASKLVPLSDVQKQ